MKTPISRLDRVIHALLWVMAVLLIPLALVVGVGRELMPLVADHRVDIERMLSRQTGLRIETGELVGDWHGLRPEITVRQLRIYARADSREPALVVPALRATPDWWATLRDLGLRLRTEVDGLQLTLASDEQGGLRVLEFADLGKSDPERTLRTVHWLLAQPGLALSDHRLRWQAPGVPVRLLRDVRIQQYRRGDDYRLQADFRLGDGRAWQHAMVRVQGDPLNWRETPWQAWLDVDDLAAWQPWLGLLPAAAGVQLQGGRAALWLDSAKGLPTAGTISLRRVGLRAEVSQSGLYQVRDLSGVVSLRRLDGQAWQLAADDLGGSVNDLPLPLQRIAIDYRADAMRASAARLSLAGAQAWLARERLLPAGLAKMLAQLQPQGWLPRLQLSLSRDNEGSWQLNDISSEFKALTVQATPDHPGVKGLAGWFRGTPERGLLSLDTRHAVLDLPQTFHEPVPVDLLRGNLRWQRVDDLWHIDSDTLQLANEDAQGHVQLAMRIPQARPGDATLELLAKLDGGRLDRAWRYVPWKSAGERTLSWLRQALRGGRVVQASFMHSGPVASGPEAGPLDMQFDLADATLDYAPGWPMLSEMDARLSILGGRLAISATRARIMDSEVGRLEAVIPDLKRSVLSVDADLAMDLDALDKLMAESPLRAHTAEAARRLALSGPTRARLGLVMQLASGHADVKVDAQLNGATIALPEERLSFSGVTGPVRFDSRRGLDASALQAQLWERSMRLSLGGESRAGHWWRQHIGIDGPVDADMLGRWLDVDLSRYLRGSAPARVGLVIPVAAPGSADLRIASSLQGMRLQLPAPLDKPAAAVWPLTYQGGLGRGDQAGVAILGTVARAGMTWRDSRLQRLRLRVGGSGGVVPEQPGTVIEADVGRLDLAAWRRFLQQQGGAGGSSRVEALPPLRQLNLAMDSVVVAGETLGATQAQIRRADKNWNIAIKGLQPATRPGWPVTEINAELAGGGGQWQLSGLTVKQPLATFTGTLAWLDGPRGATTLKGQVDGHDLARLLEQLGLPALLSSEGISAKGELRWNGQPDDFSLATLDGGLEAHLKNGRIKDVNGINPATRLFGLINASNIMRRLRLDFTDVTRKGLNFDHITLLADLQDGVARNARFDMDGPSMSIRGRGWVNLNTRELDQQLRVAVPVSSAVPVVAGFLAGPVVGGALVAADLLFDKQLSKLTSVRYRVSGPWDNLRLNDEALESLPAGTLKPGDRGGDKPDSPNPESAP